MNVRETYRAQLMGVDASFYVQVARIGGFIPKTAGLITVTSTNNVGTDITLVDEVPVVAGAYLPLPISSPDGQPITVTLSGGASGTLLV